VVAVPAIVNLYLWVAGASAGSHFHQRRQARGHRGARGTDATR
jgi:hypothetical protein